MEKLKFRIPYDKRGIVRSTLMNMKFNKDEKVWEAEDTIAGRYHANNELSKWCISDTKLPDKYQKRIADCRFEQWEHQRKAFEVVSNYKSAYIYMLPGVGKSKVIVDYHNSNRVGSTLIVCPKNVIPTWKKQFETHGTKMRINLVELNKGSSEKKNSIVKEAKKLASLVIIVNYDTVWRLPEIAKTNWSLVVFDEIHRLQDSKTRVVKFCKGLKGDKKVGLTGTCGEPKKWHGQLLCLDQNVFGTSKLKYIEKYFHTDYFGNPVGIKDKRIGEHFGIISHIEDNPNIIKIPDAQHIVKEIDLKAKKEYKKLEQEFLLEVDQGLVSVANAMVKTLKLRQICSGFIMDENRDVHSIKNNKEEVLKELLEDMEGQNIVVFYNFKHEAETLRSIASKCNRHYGNISGSQRDMDCIDSPQRGTLLAIQIRAGGTGIDGLQHNYKYCVFYSLTWSEIDHEQAIRRIHRAGLKWPVFFYFLVTKETVEEKVYKALKNKQNVLKEVAGV